MLVVLKKNGRAEAYRLGTSHANVILADLVKAIQVASIAAGLMSGIQRMPTITIAVEMLGNLLA